MKRLLILIILCLFFAGCSQKDGYTEISYDILLTKIQNEENFILLIGSKDCSHCDSFKNTIKEMNKKYTINISYIDISKLNEEENNVLKEKFPYKGTPTTINIVNGVEVNPQSRIVGAKDYTYIKERLTKWGYIKE